MRRLAFVQKLARSAVSSRVRPRARISNSLRWSRQDLLRPLPTTVVSRLAARSSSVHALSALGPTPRRRPLFSEFLSPKLFVPFSSSSSSDGDGVAKDPDRQPDGPGKTELKDGEDPGVAARAMEIVTALLSDDAQRTRAQKGQYEEHEKDLHAHLPKMRTSHSVVMRALVGNTLITTLKFGMFLRTGSDAMLSEAIHTLVDSCNQCILLIGLREASLAPDKSYQYGYGRAAFFWALVSALGMFWMGGGVTMYHGLSTLLSPENSPLAHDMIGVETYGVLGLSFVIDGYVLTKTIQEIKGTMDPGQTFRDKLRDINDPFVTSVLLEDLAATVGVVIAFAGLGMSHATGLQAYDSVGSIGVGALLATTAVMLVDQQRRFLLGQAVDEKTSNGIREMLEARPSLDAVHSVQSQWIGPGTFSYKAEVDFDGTFLAARLLQDSDYEELFLKAAAFEREDQRKEDLALLLSYFAEDVTRLVEREVKEMEEEIRTAYPAAAYIEFEPDSKDKKLKVQGERIMTEEGRKKERTHLREALVVVTHLLQQQRAAAAPMQSAASSHKKSDEKRTSTTPPWVVMKDTAKMKRIQAQMQREMRERALQAVENNENWMKEWMARERRERASSRERERRGASSGPGSDGDDDGVDGSGGSTAR